ncbi:MAG: aminotransferase class I/II-fold pyridoxal phosphate-dependent enzyme, partial [Pseudomonadota bacterium]
KYFGMTGWRLGWLVVPEAITSDLLKLAQNLFICPSAPAQYAALSAFEEESLGIMESNRVAFEERRNYLVPALSNLGFKIQNAPAGAFYVYAELPDTVGDANEFCQRLLEDHFVAITPGLDFGFARADRFVRISFARELDQLHDAVTRIERAFGC